MKTICGTILAAAMAVGGVEPAMADIGMDTGVTLRYHTPGGTKEVRTAMSDIGDGTRRLVVRRDVMPTDATHLDVLPDFARGEKGNPGYFVLPNAFIGTYRLDNGSYQVRGWPWNHNFLPLYGMKTGEDDAFVAIVKGRTRFDFVTCVSVTNGIYRTFPKFALSGNVAQDDIVVDYTFLKGKDATYAGMARTYRAYQLGRGAVRPIAERMREQPEVGRAARTIELRIRQAWKPVPSPVLHQTPSNEPPLKVAVTFDRAREIVDRLAAAGVTNVEVCLVGWNKGGHDGCWPQIFPAEPKLGGQDALKGVIEAAKRAGMQIVGHTNSSDGYTLADCWDEEYAIRDEKGKTVHPGTWGGGLMYWLCPERVYRRFYPRDCRRVAELGFRGLHYCDVTTFFPAARCWHPEHPLNAAESAVWYDRMMSDWKASVGGFASEGPYDFAAGNLDYVLYVCNYEKDNPLLDRIVPLWQIVYNGIILQNPFNFTVNAETKSAFERLKLVEFNGRSTGYFYSRFMSTPNDWMGKTDVEDLRCGTEAELVRSVAILKEMAGAYAARSDLQFVFMDDHREISPGVFETVYSDGSRTVCNYGSKPFAVGGSTIPAMGYSIANEGDSCCQGCPVPPYPLKTTGSATSGWGAKPYASHATDAHKGLPP